MTPDKIEADRDTERRVHELRFKKIEHEIKRLKERTHRVELLVASRVRNIQVSGT